MAIPESIKKLANDIRTKIYGREVRESLAKGIEEAGNIADQANTKSDDAVEQVNSIQSQVNQLVVEGDSSVEAAQARVDADGNTYATLKERLDTKEQSFVTQLAEKASLKNLNDLEAQTDKKINDSISDLRDNIIEEIGNNANGRYIRFANGVLIMYGRKSLNNVVTSTGGGITFSLPYWAKAHDYINVNIFDGALSSYSDLRIIQALPHNDLSAMVVVFNKTNEIINTAISWIVIGRWK